MKNYLIACVLILTAFVSQAQKKRTITSAVITLEKDDKPAKRPMAENTSVLASLDPKSGDLYFEAQMNDFIFSNPQIQTEFKGPDWMDVSKYGKAMFTGKITNITDVNFQADSVYKVYVSGELTLRGLERPLNTSGTLEVKGKRIIAKCNFTINLDDYNIMKSEVPKIAVTAKF